MGTGVRPSLPVWRHASFNACRSETYFSSCPTLPKCFLKLLLPLGASGGAACLLELLLPLGAGGGSVDDPICRDNRCILGDKDKDYIRSVSEN